MTTKSRMTTLVRVVSVVVVIEVGLLIVVKGWYTRKHKNTHRRYINYHLIISLNKDKSLNKV